MTWSLNLLTIRKNSGSPKDFTKKLLIFQRTLKILNLIKVLKRKITTIPGPLNSLEKKNKNNPENSAENTSPWPTFGKKANKNSGYQHI